MSIAFGNWRQTRVGHHRIGKRAFDTVISATLLLLLSPLLAVAWLLVYATTRGGAIYRDVRVGRHGRPFVMYKFRTMYVNCSDGIHREYVHKLLTEAEPPVGGEKGLYKLESDPRVTRVGRVLRKLSVDELPQLVNVVKGDMSLVGPRPALPWEAELFGDEYEGRFDVMPGITGLWQVSGRSHLSMRQGLDLDLEYVQRQSFWLDLAILLKTVRAVLSADGAP